MVEGGGFEPPKLARQIYSLIPLATREPLQKGAHSLDLGGLCQHWSTQKLRDFGAPKPVWGFVGNFGESDAGGTL